jgi:TorA maturation chaperone TorD
MNDHVLTQAGARADLCRLLSACYCEPTPAFAEERVFDSLRAAGTVIHSDLAEHARKLGIAFAGQEVAELLIDYTRLFLGPIRALAQPYESAWKAAPQVAGPATEQDATRAVREIYEQGGFDLGEDFSDLPDHVAVELEFLYVLLFGQCQAVRASNAAQLADLRALQQRFLDGHLGSWIDAFTQAVEEQAQSTFYRELAKMTRRFIRMESSAANPTGSMTH